jgi:hypothetical protein
VEAAIRAMGQTYAALGYQDPRLQDSGRLDFRLQRQLQQYGKEDPPPHRVKPVPLQVIHAAVQQCYRSALPHSQTMGDMLLLGCQAFSSFSIPENTPGRTMLMPRLFDWMTYTLSLTTHDYTPYAAPNNTC